MIDYNELRKKFPAKNPGRKKNAAAIKAIAREYEQKKAALGGLKAPAMKKGVGFYAVVIIGLLMVGSLVLSATGKGGRAPISRAQINARKSMDALATALGRYRYHVGSYPTTEEGLEQLASKTVVRKGWNGPYIRQVVKDPWGEDYAYVSNGEAEPPTLYSKGPDKRAGTTDDILPDPKLFDEPFRDTSWTKDWMPHHLRGYVLAPDARTKKVLEAEVQSLLHPALPVEGETVLSDGWEFAQVWKDTYPASTNKIVRRDLPADSPELVWKKVRVPHDWAIAGPFDPACTDGGSARLPWVGIGWYRRALTVPAKAKGSFVALRFAGVMSRPEVFLNGEKVGGWDYGYLGFEVDVSDRIRFGEKNELLVKADTSQQWSRWYPGAGLYRDVTLVVEDAEDRMLWGSLKITTPEITETAAKVRVEYETPRGKVADDVEIRNPILWSPDRPFLYSYRIFGKDYRYGIRTARFTADDGFHLNGRRLQLRGVNLHSDLGPLGMAFNRQAMRRQLMRMKDLGVNALRTSHNAPDPHVLDLCDELGFIVWNECFDKWDDTAGVRPGDDQDEVITRNLKLFVRRDRNHPCVVCWSVGNEIKHATPDYPYGSTAARCAKYRAAVLEEDATRPVAIGCYYLNCIDEGDYAPFDIIGWNYAEKYLRMRAAYPKMPVVYSESASTCSSRGFFRQPMTRYALDFGGKDVAEIDSYDRTSARGGDIPDWELFRMERDRFCAGEFVWTGVDYLGEPWPSWVRNRSSFFGICDLTVRPKDRYYLYRSQWNDRSPTVHLLPHWNWEGREGEKIVVMCYTSGDEAELYLNGESQGRRRKSAVTPPVVKKDDIAGYYKVTERYRLTWEVPYEAGEIKVVAFKDGSPIGEDVRRTAFKAFSVKLAPEETELADGELAFVNVAIVDDRGVALPLAQDRVTFTLEGPGEIVATANGSTDQNEPFTQVSSRRLYNGHALVVVRRTGGSGLPLKLSASAKGVRTDVLTLPRR